MLQFVLNHGDKLQCLNNNNTNDACCDYENHMALQHKISENLSCKELVQEAKKCRILLHFLNKKRSKTIAA